MTRLDDDSVTAGEKGACAATVAGNQYAMAVPARLTVPTCIGCGAMGRFGDCDAGCSEQRLDLVRAVAYESVARLRTTVDARAEAFRPVAERLLAEEPDPERWQAEYESVQRAARVSLREHPDLSGDEIDLEQPAEPATTWWCPECGGIDAPQPCLGICVWRPVDWVNRALYEEERAAAIGARERERRLRLLLRRAAFVTPRAEQWERNWRALAAEAKRALEQRT